MASRSYSREVWWGWWTTPMMMKRTRMRKTQTVKKKVLRCPRSPSWAPKALPRQSVQSCSKGASSRDYCSAQPRTQNWNKMNEYTNEWINERMQPPAGVQGAPCEERRKGEQEREKMRSQSEKVNVSTWSFSKCQSARKRERLVKRTELEDEMKLWSGQRIITGFNKTWISTKLKVLGGKKKTSYTVSQPVTRRHSNCCPTERPRLGPGHTAPPLSGKDLTWPELGQPIHNHHSPLLTHLHFLFSLNLFSVALFSAWFFIIIFFLLSLLFFRVSRARRDTREQRSLGRHCLRCHHCSRGSAEVLPLSKPAVPSFFLFCCSPLSFFK